MEKISNIVRGNSRVASVDLKSSSAVRPGAPSYGRSIGESPAAPDREVTTAMRAAALHQEIADRRASSQDRVVGQLADQFFMSRIRRPDEAKIGAPEVNPAEPEKAPELDERAVSASAAQAEPKGEDDVQPQGYTPRGSYVDVRA